VNRSLGLPLTLVSLAVGGYLFVAQTKATGPTAPAVTQAETQAIVAVAATNFQGAQVELQTWFADHATYAGATLSPSDGVTLVRGDASSYCVQTIAGTAVEHENGPGGQPQPGPC
jgi:hypothetical protein